MTWAAADTTVVLEGTGAAHPLINGGCMWLEGDRRQPQGLSNYFGEYKWQQMSSNYPSSLVSVTIRCFDTKHPTLSPTAAPPTAAPPLSPTEVCGSIEVMVDQVDSGVQMSRILMFYSISARSCYM